jgi:hypothetical protein
MAARRLSRALGATSGVLLLVSAAAHSLLGWPALAADLTKAGVGADLTFGLQVGWHFGGVAMVVFGLVVLHACLGEGGGGPEALPVGAIGLAYVAFGAWAYTSSGDPFFFVFLVPGALLGMAWTMARRQRIQ